MKATKRWLVSNLIEANTIQLVVETALIKRDEMMLACCCLLCGRSSIALFEAINGDKNDQYYLGVDADIPYVGIRFKYRKSDPDQVLHLSLPKECLPIIQQIKNYNKQDFRLLKRRLNDRLPFGVTLDRIGRQYRTYRLLEGIDEAVVFLIQGLVQDPCCHYTPVTMAELEYEFQAWVATWFKEGK